MVKKFQEVKVSYWFKEVWTNDGQITVKKDDNRLTKPNIE